MSLIRPVTNNSASRKNPRSPVRRKGPSPESAKWARNVFSVASHFCQYPWATLGPRTQISPTVPSAQAIFVSGSAMTTVWSGRAMPLPTRGRAPASPSRRSTA